MLKRKTLLIAAGYIVVGLVFLFLLSRFWLPSGYTLGGHDSGLPFDSKEFLKSRLFAWNPNIGFGIDNSYLFGSLTLHFVDYISSVISGYLFAGNWFNLFFWFSLIFVAAFVFAFNLKKVFGIYFAFIFPPLIIFNFYLSQSVFILERAKYSIIVGILLFLIITFKFLDKKFSLVIASFLAALTFSIFNGGSLLGVSLYGNLFVVIFALIIFYLIAGIKNRNFSYLLRLISFLFLGFVLFLIFNSYQILPYLPNIINKSYISHLGATVSQSKDWVDYISRDTSIINLLRLEGVPTWYGSAQIANPQHPYAQIYLENGLFVLVSFLFPIIAFMGYPLAKTAYQKKVLLLFFLIALVSLPFAAGTHPPFGFIYGFLYDHLPGFFIFRNPYYKFAGGYLIGICAAIAASLSLLAVRISKRSIVLSSLFCLTVLALWFGYHYVLLSPDKIFTWKPGFSTRLKVPDYVWDFRQWNEKENKDNEKILLVPSLPSDDLSDSYKWGYWSLSHFTYTLANVPSIINEGGLTKEERGWVEKLYSDLSARNEREFNSVASKLAVRYILLRKDVNYEAKIGEIEKSLNSLSNIKKVRSFGEWDLYEINLAIQPKVRALSSLTLVPFGDSYLGREFVLDKDVVPQETGLPQANLNDFLSQQIRTYTCQSCLLEKIRDRVDFPPVRVFSNSPLYFLKERKEKSELVNAKDDGTRIINYITYVFRRSSEVKSMFFLGAEDKYIISNLKKTNDYLDNAYNLLTKHPELETSYVMARQILDVITPILNELHRFVLSDGFGRRPSDVRIMMYSEIERLERLNKYYVPLLRDPAFLRSSKFYSLGVESAVFLDSLSLSKDTAGKTSFPIGISYKSPNLEANLNLDDTDKRWMKIKLPENATEAGTLALKFNLPNVYQTNGNSLLTFPSGTHGCILGKIYGYDSSRSYEINVLTKNKSQRLALYEAKLEKLVDVYPIEATVPFRYIYEPDIKNSDPSLFLCTDDRDMPDISSISVYEMISPNLESITNLKSDISSASKISYTRINPTRYSLTIENPSVRTVIALNERFSSSWRLYPADSSLGNSNNKIAWIVGYLTDKSEANHFSINGYENAWVIDPSGKRDWILEYTPQEFFYIGTAVTIFSLISLSFITFLHIKRRLKISI